jgi:hypothetical protein
VRIDGVPVSWYCKKAEETKIKIKALAAAVILSVAAVTSAHSLGLGGQANFSAGELFAPGAALLISPSDITHLALNWYLDFDRTNIIGLTLDVCPLTLPFVRFITGSFNFTLGIGFYTNIVFTGDIGFNGGLRIPVGVNLLLGRNVFEIFTHIAPSFGVHFIPSLGFAHPFFPVAVGARLWFR